MIKSIEQLKNERNEAIKAYEISKNSLYIANDALPELKIFKDAEKNLEVARKALPESENYIAAKRAYNLTQMKYEEACKANGMLGRIKKWLKRSQANGR